MKEHWYRIFIYYCPVCGYEERLRERVYGKKPKTGTHIFEERYDFCIEWEGL